MTLRDGEGLKTENCRIPKSTKNRLKSCLHDKKVKNFVLRRQPITMLQELKKKNNITDQIQPEIFRTAVYSLKDWLVNLHQLNGG